MLCDSSFWGILWGICSESMCGGGGCNCRFILSLSRYPKARFTSKDQLPRNSGPKKLCSSTPWQRMSWPAGLYSVEGDWALERMSVERHKVAKLLCSLASNSLEGLCMNTAILRQANPAQSSTSTKLNFWVVGFFHAKEWGPRNSFPPSKVRSLPLKPKAETEKETAIKQDRVW